MKNGTGIPAKTISAQSGTDALWEAVFRARAAKRATLREDLSRRIRVNVAWADFVSPEDYRDFLSDREDDLREFRKSANRVIDVLDSDEESAYAERVIRKNGKDRAIHSPDGEGAQSEFGKNLLRSVQNDVRALLDCVPLPDYAIGFRKWRSPYSSLRDILEWFSKIEACLSIDIRNFFPSVSTEMVRTASVRAMCDLGFGSKTAIPAGEAIARIATFRWGLVQGASTSPVLANLVAAARVDSMLRPLLADLPSGSAKYFRYADDVVVLSDRPLSEGFRKKFLRSAKETGFENREEKTEYRENSEYYPILWADVFSNQKWAVKFRFPKRNAKAWAKEILELSDAPDLPSEPQKFMEDRRVSRMLALLGHAAYVNRTGSGPSRARVRGESARSVAAQQNAHKAIDPIRGELRHAWEIFRKRFSDRMPDRSSKWFE